MKLKKWFACEFQIIQAILKERQLINNDSPSYCKNKNLKAIKTSLIKKINGSFQVTIQVKLYE